MPSNSWTPEQLGLQEPRIRTLPLSRVGSLIDDILDISDLAGIQCEPWQESSLETIASVDAFGPWAATESWELVSRQQGKGGSYCPTSSRTSISGSAKTAPPNRSVTPLTRERQRARHYAAPAAPSSDRRCSVPSSWVGEADGARRHRDLDGQRELVNRAEERQPRRALRCKNALGRWRPAARGSPKPGIRSWCLIQRARHRRWLARVTRR